MKLPFLLVSLLLTSCSMQEVPDLPEYKCHPDKFGVVASEFPINCSDVQSNVNLAYSIFQERLDVYKVFIVPIIVKDLRYLERKVIGRAYTEDPQYIILAYYGFALFHELCHIYNPSKNDHKGWVEIGYKAAEDEYTLNAIRLKND